MQCPQCQHENHADALFCNACGNQLEISCPSCGQANPPDANFCKKCGQNLAETDGAGPVAAPKFTSPETYTPKYLAERILTSKAALEGERKQVTVLFADLKGSMELLADRDPEDARALLDAVLTRMMEAVHRFEGTVNQVMGDGIMALFGAPLALEDHALRACYAALAIQNSMKAYAEEALRTHGLEIQTRVGLNSGEVVVRTIGSDLKMDYTAVGHTTNLAARMEQIAPPGTIRMTTDSLRLAERFIQVRSLGPVPIKGMNELVEVFELKGAASGRTRFQATAAGGLSRFVGRQNELDALQSALDKAGEGHGQVFATVAEAGVGKSRLYWEFTRSHRTKDWLVIESGSVSYGKATAYRPVIDLLKKYFGIGDTDDHRRIQEKVTGKILTLDQSLTPAIPPILSLLEVSIDDEGWKNLDPQQRRQRTLDSVKRLLLREEKVQPLVVVFEDLHWIDTETQALLDSLVESLPGAKVLLLVNYRPEYDHGWANKSYYTRLRLDPLSSEGADELLLTILGEDPSLAPLKRHLIERTEGNPFYLEESIQTLIESGAVAGGLGAYKLMEEVSEIHVPSTIQAILAARMDRLPFEEKRLLQTASVIGTHIPFPLLSAIAEMTEEDLNRRLASLQAGEFLYETNLFPEREFSFKHALTHEVTYGSLLISHRRTLHAAAGRALENLYRGRLEEVYDKLAHHYSRTEETRKAIKYHKLLAEKTSGMYAHAEALKSLEEALVHADRLPLEEQDHAILDLVVRQTESLHFMGRREEIVQILLQHQERLKRLQKSSLAGQYYFWLGWAYAWLGHRSEAAQSLSRSLKEATQAGDEALMGRAHRALCVECTYSGRPLDEAVAHALEAVSLLERTEDCFWLSQALFALSYSNYYVGNFDSVLEVAARLDALGETTGSSRARAEAAAMIGLSYATRGDWAAGIEACQRGMEISPDLFETAFIMSCMGKAHAEGGDAAQAIHLLEQAVQLADQVRSRQWSAWFQTWLGDAYRLGGQMDKAQEVVHQTLEVCTNINYLVGSGFSYQVLGRVAHAQGALVRAERHFTAALQALDMIQARFEVGRTRLFLASLAHGQEDSQAAATHLKEAHSLFTALRVPNYIERTEQLARDFGIRSSNQIAH